MWGRGEGDFLRNSPSPLPHTPSPHPSKTFPFSNPPSAAFTMPKNHSPMTIPFQIQRWPSKNARIHERIRASSLSSSNGTAAGRPPHQSKILEGKRKGVSRVAVFGRERGAVGVLSPSPERFPFPSPIQLSHSASIASRGASAAPPRHDTTYTRQNPQAPASWLR